MGASLNKSYDVNYYVSKFVHNAQVYKYSER